MKGEIRMEFLIENWTVIFLLAVLIACAITSVVKFAKSGKTAQLANLKEWLLYATTEAEKALGSGTGKLKLRTVYDMFLTKFPWLAKAISFESFSKLVDEALDNMNELLATNSAVYTYVEGDKVDEDKKDTSEEADYHYVCSYDEGGPDGLDGPVEVMI